MNSLISVVMTTYNHSLYIEESLKSVLSQSYKNIEIFVINDGSTDNTKDILNSFSDPRLKIINQENAGVSAAINAGMDLSAGEYIFLFSGDDVLYSDSIEKSLHFLKSKNCDIVFSSPDFIDENGKQIKPKSNPFINHIDIGNSSTLLKTLFFNGNFLCAPSCLCKADSLKIKRFNVSSLQLQDYEMWIDLCKSGVRFAINPVATIKYRIRSSQMNLSSRKNMPRIQFETYCVYKTFFDNCDFELFSNAFSSELRNLKLVGDRKNIEQLSKIHVYLNHQNSIVKMIGYELVWDLAKNSANFNATKQLSIGHLEFFRDISSMNFFGYYKRPLIKAVFFKALSFFK